MNQWKLYTVVIDGNSMAGYLDGEMLEEVSMDRTVSDFGTGLKAHIGTSQYLEDPLFAGSFRDLRIYDKALTGEEVQDLFELGSQRNAVLEDKENLSLGDVSNVIGNLTLPPGRSQWFQHCLGNRRSFRGIGNRGSNCYRGSQKHGAEGNPYPGGHIGGQGIPGDRGGPGSAGGTDPEPGTGAPTR